MNYKIIFLNVLLLPFALISNTDIDIQIQELRNDIYEKEQELSTMGNVIEEKEKLIESLMSEEVTLTRNTLSSLGTYSFFSSGDSAQQIEFGKEIDDFVERINKAFVAGNVKNVFMQEIFNNEKNNYALGRIKSLIIRRYVEKLNLQRLIKNYEHLFQRKLELDAAINGLLAHE